ncbi:MAG: uroporphyrinogen decarboxylase family protein [Anaerolineae bacterium]
MEAKERVHAALKRMPVDRVPVFMWFHPYTTTHLANLLEIPAAYVSEAMGNDVRQAWVNNNYAMEGITHAHDGEGHVDDWGIRWVKEGPFNQIAAYPLAQATRDEVLRYRFPTARLDSLLEHMRPAAAEGDRFFVGCDVSPCVFEMYWRLRGIDAALLDMAADPELADALFGRCADFAVQLGETACVRYALDWLWTGDDIASQRGLMMSPRSWRELIKPHLQRVFDVGKRRGPWVAFHCCGSLRPIIGDLVEMGLDVLNPVQCNCPGMDPLELKAEFGEHLSFMGGVDTQGVLPFGTVAEVRRATARLIEGMTAGGGGYILAASHTIPPETPDANIFAMYEVAGIPREEIEDRAASIRARIGDGCSSALPAQAD